MSNIPVFYIDGGELLHVVTEIYKLPLNGLSPFNGMPASVIKLSDEAGKLHRDSEFKKAAEVLASPSLKVSIRRGGSTLPFEASTVYAKKEKDDITFVYLKEVDNTLMMTLFTDVRSYTGYFAAQNASPVEAVPLNTIKATQDIETLLFIFNLLDCYRRTYMGLMLEGSEDTIDAIYEDEFLSVFEKNLKSKDIRWLLPAFLNLVPGVGDFAISLTGEQLDYAEAMDFINRSANKKENRPVYYLGSNARYMGLEFSLFWKYAAGFEVTGWDEKAMSAEILGRYFLAPTEEGNHLIRLIPMGEKAKFTHFCLSLKELEEELCNILEGYLSGLAKASGFKVSITGKANNFCGSCGARLEKGSAFCGNCGAKVI